jgi:hypothetical protein
VAHTNGTLPIIHAAPLEVRDTRPLDLGVHLLNELDDLITALGSAMAEQQAARTVIIDSEQEQAIIRASLALTLSAPPDAPRKAALTLACAADPGYQELSRVIREARAGVFTADRRIAVVQARIELVKGAIALHAAGEQKDGGPW